MTSSTRARRRLTAEEIERRADERRAARTQLSATADAVLATLADDPQTWAGLLWTAAHHPDRTGVVNLALIARQAPGQTVATYRQWQEQGRQVRRGETARVRVFTTVLRRTETAEPSTSPDPGALGTPDVPERVAAFRVGTLFTHAQTDPSPQDEDNAPAIPRIPIPNPRRPLDITHEQLTAAARTACPTATDAEAESAAHLAALILGATPGPAPQPHMPITADADPFDAVKATAAAVIAGGRHVAAALTD